MGAARRRSAMLVVVLLVSCGTAVGCTEPSWRDRHLDERVTAMLTRSLTRLSSSRPGYPGAPLRNLTPFSWDGLFVFESGPQSENVRDKTGFSFLPESGYVEEDHYLLVFVNGSNLAKVALLRDGLISPFDHFNGKKYSSQARLLSVDGGRVTNLVEPTAFQRLYDPATEDRIIAEIRTLRAEHGESVPVGDLGFAWDELRVIEPADLKRETGLSYAGLKYRPYLAAFMVFSYQNRIVRITEMSDLLFPPEERRKLRGRKWSNRVRMVVNDDEAGTFTLQEP